jgi:hypothetical protein
MNKKEEIKDIMPCFDIMELIGFEVIKVREKTKNFKLFKEIILHLEQYNDEYEDDYKEKLFVIKWNDKRIDMRFIEYNELYNTKHYEIICNNHGGKEELEEWMDDYF